MKKLVLLSFLLTALATLNSSSQSIDGFTIVPQNPTDNDSITIYVDLTFGSGSCDGHTQSFSITGQSIGAYALHCVGILTVICETTDTFSVGKLVAGTYQFTFQLDEGQAPAPCTPGIIPGPSDSFTFEVAAGTAIADPVVSGSSFYISPNPASDYLVIETTADLRLKHEVVFYSLDGKKLFSEVLTNQKTFVQTDLLDNGIYFAEINTGGFKERKPFVLQH